MNHGARISTTTRGEILLRCVCGSNLIRGTHARRNELTCKRSTLNVAFLEDDITDEEAMYG